MKENEEAAVGPLRTRRSWTWLRFLLRKHYRKLRPADAEDYPGKKKIHHHQQYVARKLISAKHAYEDFMISLACKKNAGFLATNQKQIQPVSNSLPSGDFNTRYVLYLMERGHLDDTTTHSQPAIQ